MASFIGIILFTLHISTITILILQMRKLRLRDIH